MEPSRSEWVQVQGSGFSRCLPFFLKFLRCFGPIFFEQQRKGTIGQQLPARLAMRAIVGLVVLVTDTLHFGAADGTRLPELSVHCHLLAEGGDVFGKVVARLCSQPFYPVFE